MQELTLVRPDDWHLHLRDGATLTETVAHSARYMGRAIVMPNLVPPVSTTSRALAYRDRILDSLQAGSQFQPLMTLYLTDMTTPEEISTAKASGHVYAAKLYPAGATTHSEHGVTDIEKIYPALERLAEVNLPLLVHGEITSPDTDIFDREKRFIDDKLHPVYERFESLKIVFEHITTAQAAQFVLAGSDRIGATITPQHLMYNRNDMLVGGIRPHFYCLPILKRSKHQQALQDAVASGTRKIFLGTDSAPHAIETKENACGCAGCFSAFAALELYAQIFEDLGILEQLEAFASFNGPDFYGLPRNSDKITLRKKPWQVPAAFDYGDSRIVPLKAGETLSWSVVCD